MWVEQLCTKSSITIYDFENCVHDGFPDIVTYDEVKEAVKTTGYPHRWHTT